MFTFYFELIGPDNGGITWTKFGVNQVMSAVSFLKPYGTAASAVYFGVDAFYRDGWNGVGNDLNNFGRDIYDKTVQGINQYNSGFSKW